MIGPRVLTFVLVLGLGLTSAAPSLSIQELQARIDATPRGQTVTIPSGVYQGSLVVGHPVVVRGQPGARLVRSPETKGPTLRIQGSGVTISGLEIEGTGEGTRHDQTAVVVTGARVTLERLQIRRCWSGVWLDQCADVSVSDVAITGPTGVPFWERGDGVRVTNSTNVRLQRVHIRSAQDGLSVERSTDLGFEGAIITDARYGLHGMFSSQGTVSHIETSRTVVGVMLMESSQWVVRDSRLTNGYRTGSAGIRLIRTKEVTVQGNEITRQAAGVELIDGRNGAFRNNHITQNGTAWTWGRDNSGTTVEANVHRGNLRDFAGDEPSEDVLMGPDPHQHGNPPTADPIPAAGKVTVEESALPVRPRFDRNEWDAWVGTDLDHDGIGDTPYRFDRESAARAATHPWTGIFLGSPWSQWSRGLPGGDVIDEHPGGR